MYKQLYPILSMCIKCLRRIQNKFAIIDDTIFYDDQEINLKLENNEEGSRVGRKFKKPNDEWM